MNCLVVHDTGDSVSVDPFLQSLGSVPKVPICTLAMAYDDPITFHTYILFFHQALYIKDLPNTLIAPFQVRHHGISVNEVPLQHIDPNLRTQYHHSIHIPSSDLHIPLTLQGTMSGFSFRQPTWDEVNDTEQLFVTHVDMTSDAPWNPHSSLYADHEESIRQSIDSPFDLRTPEPLQLSPLQVRGLFGVGTFGHDHGNSGTLDSLAVHPTLPDQRAVPDRRLLVAVDELDKLKGATKSVRFKVSTPTVDDASVGDVDDPVVDSLTLVDQVFDPGDNTMQPRSPSRVIQSVHSLRNQRTNIALDVDSFAESLLHEDQLQGLAHILASATTVKKRKGFVDANKLAKNWKIGKEAAQRTLDVTTQRAVRDFSHSTGGRRLKPYSWMLKYPRIECEVFTDTLFGKVKSLRGNTCCQIFCTYFHYIRAIPLKSKSQAHQALDIFFKRVGIPSAMIPDNAKELTQGHFRKKCQRFQCPICPIEAYTPNANIAEDGIREAKRHYRRIMIETGAPEVLWDYCFEWCCFVRSHTALNIADLDGQVPATKMTGDTTDISFLAEFGWYDWVWYISPHDSEEIGVKKLGRYLGPSINVGEAMCGIVLTEKTTRLDRTSIFPLTVEDLNSEPTKQKMAEFDATLKAKLKERAASMKDPVELDAELVEKMLEEDTPKHVAYEEWEDFKMGITDVDPTKKEEIPDLVDADDLDFNKYLSAKVRIPQGGYTFANGKVVRRARDSNGELIGKSHSNPLLDTSVYEVELEDGSVERYNANIIAEHIYAQVDDDGYTMMLVDEIIDHRSNEQALTKADGFVRGPNGSLKPKQTTKGWELCVRWKDGSTEWVPLKEMKESNPLQVADYAEANQIADEPAFAWWVPWTQKKKKRILKAMKKRYFRTTQKYGIELPKTVARALEIDKETGTTYWRDALEKEMKTVMVAFEFQPEDSNQPVGFTNIPCHVVFDIKAGTLQRKCRLVAGGHVTGTPTCQTYASVVSRDSVRLAFLLAALNGLELKGADCEGAYLNAPSRERLCTKCGPEFGEYAGRWAIIRRALYGSKSAAASWRAEISRVIEELGFKMCRADNDVWYRPAVSADGKEVYEYVLVYSDDLLVVACDPDRILCRIDQNFKLKDGSVCVPDRYLGANISEFTCSDGTVCWAMSSEYYVKAAIKNVELWLAKKGDILKTKAACVFPSGWKPECDTTPLLGDDDASYFQQQIGVLRWMVELGRIDICTEVSMLAAFSAAPRQGHLAAVLHLYAYLKKHERSRLVLDPRRFDHDPPKEDLGWKDFYGDVKELIPPDAPPVRGVAVQMTCFVDSDHAGDEVSRRSRTGVLIYCNRAPILWYSKKQTSIETSSFGSEFSAMKTAVELVEGLRYKLRMMGVDIEGPTYVKADNMSVIHNSSNPASTLKKKSNSIAFHFVRERAAAGVVDISYVKTDDNLADMLTKSQPGEVRRRLAGQVLF